MTRTAMLVACISVLLFALPLPAAAAELYMVDEREIYLALDKMNAMGYLPRFFANTRPYDMKGVRAALDNNPALAETLGIGFPLAQWVARYAEDNAVARGSIAAGWAEKRKEPWNSDGIIVPEGYSGELSAFGRWEPYPYLSAHAKGVAWAGTDGYDNAILGDTALEFGHKYISLQAGMISTWYGPGRGGALIFTNNAQPYPGIRLHNPVPIPMPWIFSFLGNFQYDFFFAQLGNTTRPIADPTLFGMRLAFRPSVFLEFGLNRSIQYGGEGQPDGFNAWWDAFLATRINEDSDVKENELAGFDVTLTLPFRAQPLQLYFEMAGEDQHPSTIPYPTKYAYLFGIFLPSIAGNPAFDLRVEYADSHSDRDGAAWYVHPDYPHSYKNRILGHPMGTDARDVFVEGHWFFLPSTYLQLNWNYITHYFGAGSPSYVPGTEREEINRYGASFVGWFTQKLRGEVGFLWETTEKPGGQPTAPTEQDITFRVGLSYQVGR